MKACERCGNEVTDKFARIFTRDGRVRRCPECDTMGRISLGTAAGREEPIARTNPVDVAANGTGVDTDAQQLVGGDGWR